MPIAADLLAWRSRWRAIRSTASYNPTWGLERSWREHADEWGPPLETSELDVVLPDGRELKGRTFFKIGLVVWNPATGYEVIGWLTAAQP